MSKADIKEPIFPPSEKWESIGFCTPKSSSSEVWKHFKLLTGTFPSLQFKAICKFCNKDISRGTFSNKANWNTTAISNHNRICQIKKNNKLEQSNNRFEMLNSDNQSIFLSLGLQSWQEFAILFTKWVVNSNQTFKIGESTHFKEMIKCCGYKGSIPDHRKVSFLANRKKKKRSRSECCIN